MRQLFKAQSKFRLNPITLSYQNKWLNYTFLQSQLQQHHLKQGQIIKSSKVSIFSQKIVKYKDKLRDVYAYDFNQDDLRNIQNQKQSRLLKSNQNNTFTEPKIKFIQNRSILFELSNDFNNMQYDLQENISKKNIKQTILTLAHFNCLDIKIWQRVLSFASAYYNNQNLQERLISMTGLSEYLKKFAPQYNFQAKKPFKFMYPQSYILDLIDFRNFFKSIQNQNDFIKNNDSQKQQMQKLQLLENQIYFIMKATKKADMNIYAVRDYFAKRTDQMIKVSQKHKSSKLHERLLYNIYYIYSSLNYVNIKFYQAIQKNYFQYLKKKIEIGKLDQNTQFQISNKSKQLNRLISIWKFNNRPNQTMYQEIIKPFIEFILKNNKQTNFYSLFGMNIITAGIKDHQLLTKIVLKCEEIKFREDQNLHMLKHYLNIVNQDFKFRSNYYKCSNIQNPDILKFLSNKQIGIHSSCLMNSEYSHQSFKKHRLMEYRRVQKIWAPFVKNIFQPKYKVYENATLCNYEIDFLILAKTGIIAIQIQGAHYLKKQMNSTKENQIKQNQENEESQNKEEKKLKTTGKKSIREQILKAYGVRIINIHCEQKYPTYLMQSKNNIELGRKYLIEKIQQKLKCKIEDL